MEEGMCKEFTPPWQSRWNPNEKSKACELMRAYQDRYQQCKRSRVNLYTSLSTSRNIKGLVCNIYTISSKGQAKMTIIPKLNYEYIQASNEHSSFQRKKHHERRDGKKKTSPCAWNILL